MSPKEVDAPLVANGAAGARMQEVLVKHDDVTGVGFDRLPGHLGRNRITARPVHGAWPMRTRKYPQRAGVALERFQVGRKAETVEVAFAIPMLCGAAVVLRAFGPHRHGRASEDTGSDP